MRQSLNETERVAAERRGLTDVRYQKWESGKGGEQVRFESLYIDFCAHCVLQVVLNPKAEESGPPEVCCRLDVLFA